MKKPFFGVIASVMENALSPDSLIDILSEADKANSIEIRLDAFGFHTGGLTEALKTLEFYNEMIGFKKTILTLRSQNQGGSEIIPLPAQLNFWRNTLPEGLSALVQNELSKVYVDWGLDLIEYLRDNKEEPPFPWSKIGVSHHDFYDTPNAQDLLVAYSDLKRSRALAFFKLVTTAHHKDDILRVKKLFEYHKGDPKPFISFLMGNPGKESRFDCLTWGSDGSYGYLSGRAKAALGQVSIEELLEDSRVRKALKS